MPETLRNFHVSTITNTPGIGGSLVLGAAQTGYMTWGAADDGLSFTVVIKDSAGSESRTGCVYTHSTRVLSAGTFNDSTTGVPLNLTASATVAATPLLASLMTVLFAGGGGSSLPWLDVRASFAGNIANAVTALNLLTYGGVLYFSAGAPFTTAGNHIITKRCKLLGDGKADIIGNLPLSSIECTSGTVPLFEMRAHGWEAVGLNLKCTAATAVDGSAGIFGKSAWSARVQACSFENFYRNLDTEVSQFMVITGCNFLGWWNVALRIRNVPVPDGGDTSITECVFAAANRNVPASLQIESSGGVRVIDNKFGGYTANSSYHIYAELPSTTSTVIFIVEGNSIEGASVSSIFVHAPSGASWTQWNILGNQIHQYAGSGPLIDMNASAGGNLDRVSIIGNQLGESTTPGYNAISLTNINNVTAGDNNISGWPDRFTLSGVTKFQNADAAFGVQTLTDAATITPDPSNHFSNRVTLGGNRTLALPPAHFNGLAMTIRVKQDPTGSRTLDTSAYKRKGGALTLSTAANALDILYLQRDDTDGTWCLSADLAFS